MENLILLLGFLALFCGGIVAIHPLVVAVDRARSNRTTVSAQHG